MVKKLFDKISIFTASSAGLILLFLWAFFEASFWFIAPDFLIAIYCVINSKNYKKFLKGVIIASILGGALYYLLNYINFSEMTRILVNTPFVSSKNIGFVDAIFIKYGIFGTFFQSITLIPFKIWTHFAFFYGFNPIIYLFFVAISRIFRFYIVAIVAMWISKKFRKNIEKNLIYWLVLYTILFLLLTFLWEA